MVDLSAGDFTPVEILEQRTVKKGNTAVPQIKVRWSSFPADCATWEDYYVLRHRHPTAAIWSGASAQGGNSVMSPLHSEVATDIEIDPG